MSDSEPSQQLALVPHTYQGAIVQQRLNDGYMNATAMCKAAGRLLNDYTRNRSTQEFLAALAGSTGIPVDLLVRTTVTGPNEYRGTWVHPQVAINLAQWLSAEFAVMVSEWIFEWLTGKSPEDKVWKQFEDRVSLVYDSVPAGYFCIFREIADLFSAMFSRGIDPGTKMLLDISVGWHWGKHWRDQNLEERFGERMQFDHHYPNYFAQSASNPQPAQCYPDAALAEFRRWVREIYRTQKMPAYLQNQVKLGNITPQAANNTLVALEDRERRRSQPRLG